MHDQQLNGNNVYRLLNKRGVLISTLILCNFLGILFCLHFFHFSGHGRESQTYVKIVLIALNYFKLKKNSLFNHWSFILDHFLALILHNVGVAQRRITKNFSVSMSRFFCNMIISNSRLHIALAFRILHLVSIQRI